MAPCGKKDGESRSQTLRGCVVAVAGDLGEGWKDSDVARWTTYNGGNFSPSVDDSVTHLLATLQHVKEKVPTVRKAMKFRTIHIVTKDWFEDSLSKKRRLKEKDFSLKEIQKEINTKKRRDEKAQKGIEQAENFVNANLYHIYRDETFFPYEVTLTRNDEESGNLGQKYVLYLWESNSKPHLYQFAAKFYKKPRDNRPTVYRPRETPGLLSRELADFTSFFHKKTGLRWHERVAKQGTATKDKFQYLSPAGGKPVGIIEDPPLHGWSIFGDGIAAAAKPEPQSNVRPPQKKQRSAALDLDDVGAGCSGKRRGESVQEPRDEKKKKKKQKTHHHLWQQEAEAHSNLTPSIRDGQPHHQEQHNAVATSKQATATDEQDEPAPSKQGEESVQETTAAAAAEVVVTTTTTITSSLVPRTEVENRIANLPELLRAERWERRSDEEHRDVDAGEEESEISEEE
ncbi:hypothetical protein AAE478_003678 [Parahypoxylon ruwenzoriense]